jgi:anti-sigma regulatory factor (Ser/Thr protein kinase)
MSHAVAYAELPTLPTTPAWARRHARAVLGAWQITPDSTEVAILLVSEIVKNAVAASTAQAEQTSAVAAPITQTIRYQRGQIIIEITDNNPSPPVLTDAGPDAETGRGLLLVQALAKEWYWHYPPDGGKTVCFVLSTPTQPSCSGACSASAAYSHPCGPTVTRP